MAEPAAQLAAQPADMTLDRQIGRFLIIHAGGGTTWRQLGITIMALLNHPEQMEALRADRSLMRQAIQEVTRWYPTDTAFLRYVAKDTVLEGVEMKQGSIAFLCLGTANRDRKQWEDPDKLDICLQVLADIESLPPEHPDAVAVRRASAPP